MTCYCQGNKTPVLSLTLVAESHIFYASYIFVPSIVFFHHSGDSNRFLNTESKKSIFISVYFHLLLWKVEQLWRNFATSLKQWILQLIALTCLAWFIILGTTFVLQVETMFLQMSPTLPVLGQPNPFFLSAALLKKVKMEFLHHPVSQKFGNVSNRIGWRNST